MTPKGLEIKIEMLWKQIRDCLVEANQKGLIIERLVETDNPQGGVFVQQHLTMPADKKLPEITYKLWERVSERTTDTQAGEHKL